MISKYKLTCSADRLSGITRHHYRHDFFDETTCSCNISLAGNTQDIECIYLYDSGFALEWLRRSHWIARAYVIITKCPHRIKVRFVCSYHVLYKKTNRTESTEQIAITPWCNMVELPNTVPPACLLNEQLEFYIPNNFIVIKKLIDEYCVCALVFNCWIVTIFGTAILRGHVLQYGRVSFRCTLQNDPPSLGVDTSQPVQPSSSLLDEDTQVLSCT